MTSTDMLSPGAMAQPATTPVTSITGGAASIMNARDSSATLKARSSAVISSVKCPSIMKYASDILTSGCALSPTKPLRDHITLWKFASYTLMAMLSSDVTNVPARGDTREITG